MDKLRPQLEALAARVNSARVKNIAFVTPPNPRNVSILNALGLRLPKVLVEQKLCPQPIHTA